MARLLRLTVISVIIVTAVWGVFFALRRQRHERALDEIRAMRTAMATSRSFHMHYEGPGQFAHLPKIVSDTWISCPDFEHVDLQRGAEDHEESVEYGAYSFMRYTDGWHKLSQIPKATTTLRECTSATADNPLTLPLGMGDMLAASEVQLGEPRKILSSTCRDVKITSNDRDVFYRAASQSLCIDVATHLPAEIRYKSPDQFIETVMTFDYWNQQNTPRFPEGFDPNSQQ